MAKIPNITPITDLRQDATRIVKRVTSSNEPTVITQRGRAAVVILSVEAYEHSQRELEILRLLANGQKEIRKGKGYSLDDTLADADALLERLAR